MDRPDYKTGSYESHENYRWVDRCHGLTDSTLSHWILAMPACGHISDAVEQYTGVSSATSEQYIDLRESRKVRDKSEWSSHARRHIMKSLKQLCHVCRHYVANCTVVFEGYCHIPSTKNVKHMRRKQKAVSADIIFDNTMLVSASQSKFLRNEIGRAHV